MRVRSFAGAFLQYNDEVLLMERGLHKKVAPGLWAGIGGHIEADEHNNPLAACLREIEEETGIVSSNIYGLNLRYYTVCKTKDTLDTIYYFTGSLKDKPLLIQTSEGVLHWKNKNDVLNYPMSPFIKAFYEHWLKYPDFDNIYCCITGKDGSIAVHEII